MEDNNKDDNKDDLIVLASVFGAIVGILIVVVAILGYLYTKQRFAMKTLLNPTTVIPTDSSLKKPNNTCTSTIEKDRIEPMTKLEVLDLLKKSEENLKGLFLHQNQSQSQNRQVLNGGLKSNVVETPFKRPLETIIEHVEDTDNCVDTKSINGCEIEIFKSETQSQHENDNENEEDYKDFKDAIGEEQQVEKV